MGYSLESWIRTYMSDLRGKVALVTGANSGLGYYTTMGLALRGAHVIMGCRNMTKANQAHEKLLNKYPKLSLEIEELDLASLDSISESAFNIKNTHRQLDILCNNAGIMMIPESRTEDDFEKQFGVNHLGHFALTGHLMPMLLKADRARIVNVSSIYHKRASLELNDLNWAYREYDKSEAYAQSKLANLLFTYELERKLRKHNTQAISLAAHPGYSDTNLQFRGPEMSGSKVMMSLMKLANRLIAQPADKGATPILYAAAHPNTSGGEYIGPDGFMELRGYPTKVTSSDTAKNERLARSLWEKSVKLTGVEFSFEAKETDYVGPAS